MGQKVVPLPSKKVKLFGKSSGDFAGENLVPSALWAPKIWSTRGRACGPLPPAQEKVEPSPENSTRPALVWGSIRSSVVFLWQKLGFHFFLVFLRSRPLGVCFAIRFAQQHFWHHCIAFQGFGRGSLAKSTDLARSPLRGSLAKSPCSDLLA